MGPVSSILSGLKIVLNENSLISITFLIFDVKSAVQFHEALVKLMSSALPRASHFIANTLTSLHLTSRLRHYNNHIRDSEAVMITEKSR